MQDYDIVVIGAGVAGLYAGTTAAKLGARTLVLDRMGVGGQVATVESIQNYPGQDGPVAGYEIGPTLQEEAEAAGAEFALGEVIGLSQDAGGVVVDCHDRSISTRAVIVAAGSTRRELGVPGESEMSGKGVSHCASCDGPFFRNGRVIVVGGGDSAFDEAAVLAATVKEVLIVHHGSSFRARPAAVAEVSALANVTVLTNHEVVEVLGDSGVTGVSLRDLSTGALRTEAGEGVFVYTGLVPNTEPYAAVLELDPLGRIIVGTDLQTSLRGVYAAGDIRSGSIAMLSEAAEDGERAARAAWQAINNSRDGAE